MMSQLTWLVQPAPSPQMMAAPRPQTGSWKLDARISEERMIALDPPGCPPWPFPDYAARIWTMDAAGVADANWQWPDCVSWSDAVAFRMEDQFGNPIDALQVDEDDDYGW